MTPKTFIIKKLMRFPQNDPSDELIFNPGVNVIVGKPNTGKTKWLNMLDYLLGDPGKPEDAFGKDLVEKYDSIAALVSVGEEEFSIERRWKERGNRTKVYVNDKAIPANEFQHFLMDKLGIPLVHFPKGNPYEERKWPELSWRILLRHIYRQQRFWSDIADKQPESEQHASIMQFLGAAELLFSESVGQLVEKRRELWKQEGASEQFLNTLDQIYQEVADEKEIKVALTADSLDMVSSRIDQETVQLRQRKEHLLLSLRNATSESLQGNDSEYESLGEQWAKFQEEKEKTQKLLGKVEQRLEDLSIYGLALGSELERISRAKGAGTILVDLKVTHCPVCDQTAPAPVDHEHCYLCGQALPSTPNGTGLERIELEIQRLKDERKEVLDLLSGLSEERDQRRKDMRYINENLDLIENRLQPLRQAAAAILPPEISMIDMELGRLHEKQRQVSRIKSALEIQKLISAKVDEIKQEIGELKSIVDKQSSKIHYAFMGDLLAEHMTTYLNELYVSGSKAWSLGRINVTLKEREVDFRIDGEKWSTKAGGTLSLYFLLSYHYGLMRLVFDEDTHYPGLTIIDLPATLADGTSIEDKENFIIEPFVRLLNRDGMENTQAIIAGASFTDLEGVTRYELQRVWK